MNSTSQIIRGLVLQNAQVTNIIESGFVKAAMFNDLQVAADLDRVAHIIKANAFIFAKFKYMSMTVSYEPTELYNTIIEADMNAATIEVNIKNTCVALKATNDIDVVTRSVNSSAGMYAYKVKIHKTEGVIFSKDNIQLYDDSIKSVDLVSHIIDSTDLLLLEDVIRGVKYGNVLAKNNDAISDRLDEFKRSRKNKSSNSSVRAVLLSDYTRHLMQQIHKVNPHFTCGDKSFRAVNTRKNPEKLLAILKIMQAYI